MSEPYTGRVIPNFKSDELELEFIEELGPGGHSCLFKVKTSVAPDRIVVLKLFRFKHYDPKDPNSRLEPYTYYNNEVESYSKLAPSQSALFPKVFGTCQLTPEDEQRVVQLPCKYSPRNFRRRNRKTIEEWPWTGLLLEYIDGVRLTRQVFTGSKELQNQLLQAIELLVELRILWNDVTWRNLMVKDGNRLVIIDFSNAILDPTDEQQRDERRKVDYIIENGKCMIA